MFFYFQRASFACVPFVYLAAQPAFQAFRYFGSGMCCQLHEDFLLGK